MNIKSGKAEQTPTLEDKFDSIANTGANDPLQDTLLMDNHFDNCGISHVEHSDIINDFFDRETQFKKNKRVATRCIRDDISASIKVSGLLGFGKTIPVDLIDISSKGVQLSTPQRLGIDKKIILTLQFNSGKTFLIKAVIVHYYSQTNNHYGVKFNHYNNELGDYLLETQETLKFK